LSSESTLFIYRCFASVCLGWTLNTFLNIEYFWIFDDRAL